MVKFCIKQQQMLIINNESIFGELQVSDHICRGKLHWPRLKQRSESAMGEAAQCARMEQISQPRIHQSRWLDGATCF
jgi:hypothetical protein